MTIWIDAGHGGAQPGAVSGERLEKDDALHFALELERCFLERGCKTVMTRRTDISVELGERTRLERENECDLAISCHRNSGGAGARGVEVWLHHAAKPSVVRWGQETAAAVSAQGLPLRAGTAAPGVYLGYRSDPRLDYAVNRDTLSPSMLLEVGFITSREDNLVFDSGMQAMCRAVANASCRFLGLPEQPQEETPPPAQEDYEALYRAQREQSEKWQARAATAENKLKEIAELCTVL